MDVARISHFFRQVPTCMCSARKQELHDKRTVTGVNAQDRYDFPCVILCDPIALVTPIFLELPGLRDSAVCTSQTHALFEAVRDSHDESLTTAILCDQQRD